MDLPPPLAPTRSLPAWLRLADLAAGALLLLTVWQVLTGGARGGVLRFIVPPGTSTSLLLYAAASVLIVRHLARPAPSALARLRRTVQRIGEAPVWGPVWRAFLTTRLMVLIVAFFAVAAIGMIRHPGFQLSDNVLQNLPARFDAGWYGGIAISGYEWNGRFERQSDIAFFPAMPMLMRVVGAPLGARDRERPREVRMARLLWGGVLISWTAFLFALYYLAKVGGEMVGPEGGANAAWLLACYPFAFVYNAPYTEALFLLAGVAMVYHWRRENWAVAAGWGLLAGLSRPSGFLLALPLGLIALRRIFETRMTGDPGWLRRGAAPFLVAATPVIGMLAFTVYVFGLTGHWFAWRRSHAAWGRSFEGLAPFEQVWTRLSTDGLIAVAQTAPFDLLNALGLLFALALIWPVYRRLGGPWAAYVLVSIAAPLLAGGLLSMGRLTATLFPLFLTLAAILPSRSVPHWAAAFAMLQGLCTALFFTWRPLY